MKRFQLWERHESDIESFSNKLNLSLYLVQTVLWRITTQIERFNKLKYDFHLINEFEVSGTTR